MLCLPSYSSFHNCCFLYTFVFLSFACNVRRVFLHLFTVARSSSKYLSFVIIINHKIIFCTEDKFSTKPLEEQLSVSECGQCHHSCYKAGTLIWIESKHQTVTEHWHWNELRWELSSVGGQTGHRIYRLTWTARTSSWRPANREAGEDDGGWVYCLQCQGDFAQFHKLFRDGADVNCRGGEPLREAITNSHVIIWTQVTLIIIIITIITSSSLSSWWCWSAAGVSPAGPGAQRPEWEDSPARGLLVQQG